MTETQQPTAHDHYSHDLLVHADDEALLLATRLFVERGLAAGGHVLVHSTRPKVALIRQALAPHPRLTFGYDEEMYLAPSRTLFTYQREIIERSDTDEVWVVGSVPVGESAATRAAWARYESAVNEALGGYAFHALCTYDARVLPPQVIAAARATHPTIGTGAASVPSPEYFQPAAFLETRMADVPAPPAAPTRLDATVTTLDDLAHLRRLVRSSAEAWSAVDREGVEDLVVAVNEVTANAVVHGAPPVRVSMWVDLTTLTCQVSDAGTGCPDVMAGYRYPGDTGPMGLWAARQQVDDLFIGRAPGGGACVLLIKT